MGDRTTNNNISENRPPQQRTNRRAIHQARSPYGHLRSSTGLDPNSDMFHAIYSTIVPIRTDRSSRHNNPLKSSVTTCSPPSFYEESSVSSKRRSLLEVIPDNLKDAYFPETAILIAVKKILSSDSVKILEGFKMAVCMIRYHPTILRRQNADMTEFIWKSLPRLTHSNDLIVRSALIFFKELVPLQLKSTERSSRKIIEKLLDKSGTQDSLFLNDVQTALREFITVLPGSIAFWMIQSGFKHQNLLVRKTAVMLLDFFIEKIGPQRFVNIYSHLAVAAMAKCLLEGRLDLRSGMQDVLKKLVPFAKMRFNIRRFVPTDLLNLLYKPIDMLIDDTQRERKKARLYWETSSLERPRLPTHYMWMAYSSYF